MRLYRQKLLPIIFTSIVLILSGYERQDKSERKEDATEQSPSLQLTDPNLYQYPFIYIAEGGGLLLSPEEVMSLRKCLMGGGFLMADDFWGQVDENEITTRNSNSRKHTRWV